MFLVLLHQYWNADDLPKTHCIVIPLLLRAKYCDNPYHSQKINMSWINHTGFWPQMIRQWQYSTQPRCSQEVCSFQNLKKASGKLYKRLVHGTHSPQIQIRLVMNLYLEPVRRSGNVIWVRNVCATFGRVDCPALPCLSTIMVVLAFFFLFTSMSAFNQLYPERTSTSQSPDYPLDFCTLEWPK